MRAAQFSNKVRVVRSATTTRFQFLEVTEKMTEEGPSVVMITADAVEMAKLILELAKEK